MKEKCCKLCKRMFCHKCVGVRVPASSVVFELVKTVCSTGSFIDKKYAIQNAVLMEEILHKIGARLEHSHCKSLA
jgi:hypothetical protein